MAPYSFFLSIALLTALNQPKGQEYETHIWLEILCNPQVTTINSKLVVPK